MTTSQRVRITTVYSRNDGGWYCEVWDEATGRELYSTRIFPTRREAEQAAKSADAYRVPPQEHQP